MNHPNPTCGRPSKGVGRGQLDGALYKSIKKKKKNRKICLTLQLCVFNELLARRQKWWPKQHSSLTAGAQQYE